jgi:hypothetical protein
MDYLLQDGVFLLLQVRAARAVGMLGVLVSRVEPVEDAGLLQGEEGE